MRTLWDSGSNEDHSQGQSVYLISIVVLMVLAPAASALLELHRSPGAPVGALALRWAVFWMVGGRLLPRWDTSFPIRLGYSASGLTGLQVSG